MNHMLLEMHKKTFHANRLSNFQNESPQRKIDKKKPKKKSKKSSNIMPLLLSSMNQQKGVFSIFIVFLQICVASPVLP